MSEKNLENCLHNGLAFQQNIPVPQNYLQLCNHTMTPLNTAIIPFDKNYCSQHVWGDLI